MSGEGYWYIASPYSNYHEGHDAAFQLAARAMGLLITAGIRVFSPIVHTHPVAKICGINPTDLDIWLPAEELLMHGSRGVIMLRGNGWVKSRGMKRELSYFRGVGKPVVYMDPGVLPDEFERGIM